MRKAIAVLMMLVALSSCRDGRMCENLVSSIVNAKSVEEATQKRKAFGLLIDAVLTRTVLKLEKKS